MVGEAHLIIDSDQIAIRRAHSPLPERRNVLSHAAIDLAKHAEIPDGHVFEEMRRQSGDLVLAMALTHHLEQERLHGLRHLVG